MNKIFYLIYLGVLFSSFVCSVVTFKHLPGPFRLFTLLLGVTFVVESIGFYGLFYGEPALYLYHFYSPFTYVVMAYVYGTSLKTDWKRKLIWISIPVMVVLCSLLTLFVQPLYTANSYESMLIAALFVLFALVYYYDLLNAPETTKLTSQPLFWISTGNLIFYAGIFFLEGFVGYFIKYAPALGQKLMFINYFLNFVLYTLYSIGLLSTRPKQKAFLLQEL